MADRRPRRRDSDKGRRGAPASGRGASEGSTRAGRSRDPHHAREHGRAHDTEGSRRYERRDDRGRRRREEPAGGSKYESVHLSDDVVKELRRTARPGKGDILVKVFSEAVAAFAAEDYDEAVRLGEQAKHIALRALAARELLGLAYYRLGRWQEAARELSAFRRFSGSTEQNPVIADCYRALKKPEKAIELCDEIDPRKSDPAVYYEGTIVAAGTLADMGRVDEAIARLETLELDPDFAEEHHVRAWYALADLLARRGRFTQARSWFEAVVTADPELTDAGDRLRKLDR